MFSIHSIQKDGLDVVQLCDDSHQTVVDIVPSVGAILHGFTVQHNGAPMNVVDHYPSASAAEKEFESGGFSSNYTLINYIYDMYH
jgi:aldose 1-epimerase